MDDKLPEVRNEADILAHDGQRVVVVGDYTQWDVRMRARPPAVHAGHVAVVLEDDTPVFLEPTWSEAAIRPEQERGAFTDRRVRAVGLLHAEAPEPELPIAAIVSPCLSPVEAVQAGD